MKHKLASLKVKQLVDFVLLKEGQSHFAPPSNLGGFSKTLSFVQVLVVSFFMCW
jgi:hypothetical protein